MSVLVTVLALSACGGNSENESTSTSSQVVEPTTVTSAPPTTSTPGAEITIVNFGFSGATSVAVGTTVTVVNQDSVTHTWTSADELWNSGGLGGGESFEFTFDLPGVYAYFCSIHPTMEGTITVEG